MMMLCCCVWLVEIRKTLLYSLSVCVCVCDYAIVFVFYFFLFIFWSLMRTRQTTLHDDIENTFTYGTYEKWICEQLYQMHLILVLL